MEKVGIVLVSHSYELVRGLERLLRQLNPAVPLAIAGGTEEGEIGTSAYKIKEAIEQVMSRQGAVVLFDLGSALINAELAIEWLPEASRERVRIVDAPLVEGAYAAVVQSGLGGSLAEVAQTAQDAKQMGKL
ncbi:PTS-dependent dihydroxyacetone kinase phosphotransferase subunit DhaM [Brevibacillus sp. SYP-B805]|uniref:dihydroxyacetone kinase phosphoryl donor subunit DhaM n=1 Tax=Brevibacillus sp. SYP-B805 TaxID=1578199 RepID=UPI0013EB73D0|nr:dihydroxyacetone kinase phosphoryl donor subunit DhaM [Brevibacillus sp. SYP-B805]NGQ93778.1 PTS-dependent dihydroxyacetone kinase phosphotransferase subunit DhaM [Brevibacillus sp. SYP-B805]